MGLLVDMGSKYDTKAKGDDTKKRRLVVVIAL